MADHAIATPQQTECHFMIDPFMRNVGKAVDWAAIRRAVDAGVQRMGPSAGEALVVGAEPGTPPDDVARQLIATRRVRENFWVVDVGEVVRRYVQFLRLLPGVKPFYAVKCNPDPVILGVMAALENMGFDCASRSEIQSVVAAGGSPSRIIFANPAKSEACMRGARAAGVVTMTFDSLAELERIAACFPRGTAQLVLRIRVDDSHAALPLGAKFGASLGEVPALLRRAVELRHAVIGVSFHVGSGCYTAEAYTAAVRLARVVFDTAAALGLPPFTLLDLGGGWPGSITDFQATSKTATAADYDGRAAGGAMQAITSHLVPELVALVPEVAARDLHVIAEPGRYFVEACHSFFTQVYAVEDGKAEQPQQSQQPQQGCEPWRRVYRVSDGVHGAFRDAVLIQREFEAEFFAHGELLLGANAAACSSTGSTGSTGSTEDEKCGIDAGICVDGQSSHDVDDVVKLMRATQLAVSADGPLVPSVLLGPSGDDERDSLATRALLPRLEAGDWLKFGDMGAYTKSLQSAFCCTDDRPCTVYVVPGSSHHPV